MRLSKFIASRSTYSRRAADALIAEGKVWLNGKPAQATTAVQADDRVMVDGKPLESPPDTVTLLFNKPAGYVCSRDGQGSKTIYTLLPEEYRHLNYVGRLDKESTGLLLLTNDGELTERLTHPRYQKIKQYEVVLDKALQPLHQQMISDYGIRLEDGASRLQLEKRDDAMHWSVTMHEGRNRQIRRTFAALGYEVTGLHRTIFGDYRLELSCKPGDFSIA